MQHASAQHTPFNNTFPLNESLQVNRTHLLARLKTHPRRSSSPSPTLSHQSLSVELALFIKSSQPFNTVCAQAERSREMSHTMRINAVHATPSVARATSQARRSASNARHTPRRLAIDRSSAVATRAVVDDTSSSNPSSSGETGAMVNGEQPSSSSSSSSSGSSNVEKDEEVLIELRNVKKAFG